jgi:phospholipase C
MRRSSTQFKFLLWGLALLGIGFLPNEAGAQISYPNPIKHVILVDQENRTVDNLFGSNSPSNQYYLPGLVFSTTGQAYTQKNGITTTFTVQAVPIPLASTLGSAGSIEADDYDPSHSHTSWGEACDAPVITDPSNLCVMDGFNHVGVSCDPKTQGCPGPEYPNYAYVQYSDVEPYFQIAAQYGYANYMFQTNQGPSFPSHQFIFGGTSQPGNGPDPTWYVAENENVTGAGCLAPSNATVPLLNPATQDENVTMYPCFQHDTMADVFAAADPPITWTYYTGGDDSIWTGPTAIQSICTPVNGKCTGQYWTKGESNGYVDGTPSHLLSDIAKCKLQQVNWVIPTGLESDHAGQTDGSGPSWVASIVNAVGNNPACSDGEVYWNDTVILITWDDWGGWFETVTPPPVSLLAPYPASSYVYGFRVPLLVVSAYTPPGTVSNVMGLDFGAMLLFTEEIFNLGTIPPGDYADSYANDDLSEFFQFNNPPQSFQAINAPFKADVFLDPNRPKLPPDDD